MPLATCRYVLTTGDTGVLDESVPFVQSRPVNADEDSYYDLPGGSEEVASLYQHVSEPSRTASNSVSTTCCSSASVIWNDGMNLVGEHGKGESLWFGFFLYEALMCFTEVPRTHADGPFRRALRKGGGGAAPQCREARLGRRVVPPSVETWKIPIYRLQ
jgi:cellobiose phosphorylase